MPRKIEITDDADDDEPPIGPMSALELKTLRDRIKALRKATAAPDTPVPLTLRQVQWLLDRMDTAAGFVAGMVGKDYVPSPHSPGLRQTLEHFRSLEPK